MLKDRRAQRSRRAARGEILRHAAAQTQRSRAKFNRFQNTFGQHRSNVDRALRPMSADVEVLPPQILVEAGPNSAEIGQSWPIPGKHRPKFAESGPTSVRSWSSWAVAWPSAAPNSVGVSPSLVELGRPNCWVRCRPRLVLEASIAGSTPRGGFWNSTGGGRQRHQFRSQIPSEVGG